MISELRRYAVAWLKWLFGPTYRKGPSLDARKSMRKRGK